MKKEQIHIRDPFVLYENGKYYLYGTRASDFGRLVSGFDVYVSDDLENWSEPIPCFDSARFGLNREVNWAPEVHRYKGKYFMFATFTQENGLRGTYSLCADTPLGPFEPNSKGALTPTEWECLDGTLYVGEGGEPYLVFCREHTQIVDGTICYVRLNDSLDQAQGEAVTLFSASSTGVSDPIGKERHFVTDGPFMYRSKTGELFMIWSTFIKGKYAECILKFKDGKPGTAIEHLEPLLNNDGGHGMIFSDGKRTYLTYHTPNIKGAERPMFRLIEDRGETVSVL